MAAMVAIRMKPVDPRACGVNVELAGTRWDGNGRSPRMRGKRIDLNDEGRHVRSIPAHAG